MPKPSETPAADVGNTAADIAATLRLFKEKPQSTAPITDDDEAEAEVLDEVSDEEQKDTLPEEEEEEEVDGEPENTEDAEEDSQVSKDSALSAEIEKLRKDLFAANAQIAALAQSKPEQQAQEEVPPEDIAYVDLTSEQAADIIQDPGIIVKAINDGLNAVRRQITEGLRQDMRVKIPQLVDQHVTNAEIIRKRQEAFWSRNKDLLIDMPEAVVFKRQAAMSNIMNKLWTEQNAYYTSLGTKAYDQLALDTERDLRTTLGVALLDEQQVKTVNKQPNKRPRKKKFPGASSRHDRTSNTQKNALDKNSPEHVFTRGKGYKSHE